MRAVRYAGGKVVTVDLPAWVEVDVTCFPPIAEAKCARCGRVIEFDGAQSQAEHERELGRFAETHRRCQERPAVAPRRVEVSAQPSAEWMRAFERGREGDG